MTAGQRLAVLSGLSSGTAAAHLLAITTSSGGGATIFASRFTVAIEQPQVVAVRRAKRVAQPTEAQAPRVVGAPTSKRADVLTRTPSLRVFSQADTLYLTSAKQSRVHVFTSPQQVISRRQRTVSNV